MAGYEYGGSSDLEREQSELSETMAWLRRHRKPAALLKLLATDRREWTTSEIAEKLDISGPGVGNHVKKLKDRGLLKKPGGQNGRYEATREGMEAIDQCDEEFLGELDALYSVGDSSNHRGYLLTGLKNPPFRFGHSALTDLKELAARRVEGCCSISFPGFQGGVGRTTLIAELGLQLARRGNHVILLDLNLPCPGLEYQEGFRKVARRSEGLAGLIERVLLEVEVCDDVAALETSFDDALVQVPMGPSDPMRSSLMDEEAGGGELWLLPVRGNCPEEVVATVAGIGWEDLYRSEQNQGQLFWAFLGNWLRQRVASKSDRMSYVLMDSPVGSSMLSKIATVQLVDLAVALVPMTSRCHRRNANALKWLAEKHLAFKRRKLSRCVVASLAHGDLGVDLSRSVDELRGIYGDAVVPFLLADRGEVDVAVARSIAFSGYLEGYEPLADLVASRNPLVSDLEREAAQERLDFSRDPKLTTLLDRVVRGGQDEGQDSSWQEGLTIELERAIEEFRRQQKYPEAEFCRAMLTLPPQAGRQMIEGFRHLEGDRSRRQVVDIFTFTLEELQGLAAHKRQRVLAKALAGLAETMRDNPWYWASCAATQDEQCDLGFACGCLRNAVSDPPRPLPPAQEGGNPYRPGLPFEGAEPEIFLGRESSLERLSTSSGVYGVAAPSGYGKSWLLKKLQADLRDDGRPVVFLEGGQIARRISGTRRVQPLWNALVQQLAPHYGEALPCTGSADGLMAVIESWSKGPGAGKRVTLLVDDLDACIEAIQSVGDDPEVVLRSLFESELFELIAFTSGPDIKSSYRYGSTLGGLSYRTRLRSERETIQKTVAAIYPGTASWLETLEPWLDYSVAQAMLWGWCHWNMNKMEA